MMNILRYLGGHYVTTYYLFSLFVIFEELKKKRTVPCTVSSICLYTTISASGKQTRGSHHSVAITIMEAQCLASPKLPIKKLPGRQLYLAMNNLVFKSRFLPNVYLVEQMGHHIALTIPQPHLFT